MADTRLVETLPDQYDEAVLAVERPDEKELGEFLREHDSKPAPEVVHTSVSEHDGSDLECAEDLDEELDVEESDTSPA